MRFVVAGAGAIGAYIGARMVRAGKEVVLFARGPHYQAMKQHGVRVRTADEEFVVKPEIVDDLEKAGPADFVFLGVKAQGLPALVSRLGTVIGPNTAFVSTQNGIPWWYFQNYEGPLAGTRLESIDPGGVISATIPAERIIGSIIYFSSEVSEPGVVRHTDGHRITLGELDGARSERIRMLAEALIASGFKAPVTTRIREEIWVKILGNMSFNPISALTGATLIQMTSDPHTAALVKNMMTEAAAVAGKIGIELPVTIERRIEGAAKVGEHKTSMLQDLEAGRSLEIEAIVGAVLELGERLGVEMPHTRAVYACTRLLAKTRSKA